MAPTAEQAAPSGWALATAGMHSAPVQQPGFGKLQKAEVAGWWARLGAYLLDSIFAMVFLGVVAAAVYVIGIVVDPTGMGDLAEWFGDGAVGDPSSDGATMWLVIGLLVLLVAYVWWEVWWIRSPKYMSRPGQLVAGFRVVTTDRVERVGTGRAFGRAFSKMIISGLLGWFYYLICGLTIGLSDRRQALHDMISGTACVRKDALARRGVGPDAAPGSPLLAYMGTAPAAAMPGSWSPPGATPGTMPLPSAPGAMPPPSVPGAMPPPSGPRRTPPPPAPGTPPPGTTQPGSMPPASQPPSGPSGPPPSGPSGPPPSDSSVQRPDTGPFL